MGGNRFLFPFLYAPASPWAVNAAVAPKFLSMTGVHLIKGLSLTVVRDRIESTQESRGRRLSGTSKDTLTRSQGH
ncbi:hypothetical protein OH76DRAFT_109322 [Lentinus brumalis]|uniref:Uncharacterized protein n=1 Tax=Lentinus brumalis TaxID=2498619 RepID=A0A371CPZ4_9APHY|nr:hypothetical protein OH76DRAFT_109322 [Polyporus brumalis]